MPPTVIQGIAFIVNFRKNRIKVSKPSFKDFNKG